MVTNNRENLNIEYKGLSTDAKPTSAAVNSVFIELDTGDVYYYSGAAWVKVGV